MTDEHFAERLKDYLEYCQSPSVKDIPLLKIGRHFRSRTGHRIIVSKNEPEGEVLLRLAPDTMSVISPVDFNGPEILTDGPFTDEIVEMFRKYGKPHPFKEQTVSSRHGELTQSHSFGGEKEPAISSEGPFKTNSPLGPLS